MQTLKKERLSQLLQNMNTAGPRVFVPVEEDGVKSFQVMQAGVEPALGGSNTVLSPKEVLFPQTERMYSYQVAGLEGNLEEAEVTTEKRVVVGARPCDVKGFQLMDHVFLTKGYEDGFYKTRRENTLVISLACLEPETTCFCDSLGINPGMADGADIMMYDLGDSYGFEALSEAGKELLASQASLLQETGQEPPAGKECSLKVNLEGITEKLQGMFEHPLWTELCKKCLGCGICTHLCPTCHCFDIQVASQGEGGYRFRCWDSCMFPDYTQMAGGHNPRPTRKERVRQRFLHKLQYFPERYGEFGCVGCGRCLKKCPVHMDITRIAHQVQEVSING